MSKFANPRYPASESIAAALFHCSGFWRVIMATGLPSIAGAWSSSSTCAPPSMSGLPSRPM
jgi:hypothetical protein